MDKTRVCVKCNQEAVFIKDYFLHKSVEQDTGTISYAVERFQTTCVGIARYRLCEKCLQAFARKKAESIKTNGLFSGGRKKQKENYNRIASGDYSDLKEISYLMRTSLYSANHLAVAGGIKEFPSYLVLIDANGNVNYEANNIDFALKVSEDDRSKGISHTISISPICKAHYQPGQFEKMPIYQHYVQNKLNIGLDEKLAAVLF